MAIYDPVETDLSKEYLLKLVKGMGNKTLGILGGWAVYALVNEGYRRAVGKFYIGSRDIDAFIDSKNPESVNKLKKVISELGFFPSSPFFRQRLIIDRETGKPISESDSKGRPLHELVNVDLDIFGSAESNELKLWATPIVSDTLFWETCMVSKLEEAYITVPSPAMLLALKSEAILNRDNPQKRQKDAADIYALLFYSGLVLLEIKKIKYNDIIKRSIAEIIKQEDYVIFIASELFSDALKSSLVKANLLYVLETI